MNQHHADLARVDAPVQTGHITNEIVQLGDDLDARKPAPRHHERQQLLAQLRIVAFDIRLFQGADHVAAQLQRVGEVLERQRVLGKPRQPAKVGHRSRSEH